MDILVTGGNGFIGSCLIKKLLLNTDVNVINLDCLTYAASTSSLREIEHIDTYIHKNVDINDKKKVAEVFDEYNIKKVIHLAAESHVDNSINDPSIFLKTNILGTFNLLQCSLEKNKDEDFLFHHVSTDEVYGQLSIDDEKFHENSRYKPSSPYSASKASSDHIVRAWGNTYKLPYVITNCSNNYGPYQHREKLIPNTIFKALNNQEIPVYGNGKQIRDWLHVEDHADALIEVAFSGLTNDTFNIGSNNEINNLDLVQKICNILNKNFPNKNIKDYKELITFVDDRPGHDFRYSIDNSKIRNVLRWNPKIDFDEGLLRTVKWYKEAIDEKKI